MAECSCLAVRGDFDARSWSQDDLLRNIQESCRILGNLSMSASQKSVILCPSFVKTAKIFNTRSVIRNRVRAASPRGPP